MADTRSAASLRERFDAVTDHTVGVEEELMLLDPGSLDLLPAAARVAEAVGDRVSLRTELPAAQVETASPVCDSIAEAAEAIAAARHELAAGVAGWARLAGSGTHPFAAPGGTLRDLPKYDTLKEEFRWVLPQQLVFGLHVHVAVRGADRALAVLNALRSHLPDLAALAGNAPLHAGRETGLASVRPQISGLLPRQGVPPAFPSWDALAGYLAWGRRGGVFPDHGEPWWEVRAHEEHGTIELRVPDAQTTAAEAAGVLAVGAGLVAWLAERYDAGESLPVHDTIRITENRWRALRHGLTGALLDLESGEQEPARARVLTLIDRVAPAAERLAGAVGPRAVVASLADAFLP